MTKKPSIITKIKGEFIKTDVIKLDELYSILSQDNDLKSLSPIDLKHRVRSSIYSMKKQGCIKQISKSTYEIVM